MKVKSLKKLNYQLLPAFNPAAKLGLLRSRLSQLVFFNKANLRRKPTQKAINDWETIALQSKINNAKKVAILQSII
jgi:hypothetical protein